MTTSQAAPGNVRYTIETSKQARIEIANLAKQYRITQGEVVECLLGSIHPSTMVCAMTQTRVDKIAERKARREQDAAIKAALAAIPADKRAALLGESP